MCLLLLLHQLDEHMAMHKAALDETQRMLDYRLRNMPQPRNAGGVHTPGGGVGAQTPGGGGGGGGGGGAMGFTPGYSKPGSPVNAAAVAAAAAAAATALQTGGGGGGGGGAAAAGNVAAASAVVAASPQVAEA